MMSILTGESNNIISFMLNIGKGVDENCKNITACDTEFVNVTFQMKD